MEARAVGVAGRQFVGESGSGHAMVMDALMQGDCSASVMPGKTAGISTHYIIVDEGEWSSEMPSCVP